MYSPTDLLYTQRCANATNVLYTQHFLLKIHNSKISSFCYAHKRPSPFFLYIPTKNPLFNNKVWTYYLILVSKRVKSQKMKKTGPHKTRYCASAKISFIIAIQPFHWCRQNVHKKYHRVATCRRCVYAQRCLIRCVYNKSVAFYTKLCI